MNIARQLVRYGYAPFMLLGLNGLALYLVTNGHSFLWAAPIVLTAMGVTFLAERVSPAHDEWNHSHGDETANILHAAVYELQNINGILLIPLITFLFPWGLGIWPTDWPIVAQLLMAILFADAVFTFIHYLSHRLPILWKLHAIHHGVTRLYGFNGLVRHPLHQVIDMVLGTMPLVILGMPVEVALLLGVAISIQLVVQHSNIDYALGPFRNVLSVGEMHHLHHVNWGIEGDCNFGLFFTLWDRVLGTFEPQSKRKIEAHDLGIDDVLVPKSFLDQVLFPLHYKPGPLGKAAIAARAAKDASVPENGGRLYPAE